MNLPAVEANMIAPIKTGAGMARGKSKQDYATPPDFMAAVTKRFGPISFDLAAHEGNSKHPFYYTEADNSLTKSWHQIEGLLWLNPPFDKIGPWAEKCHEEAELGANILFLVPASVGSNWYRDFVYKKSFIMYLNGRIHFDPAHPTWGYPKDTMLCAFGVESVGEEIWTWK